MLIYLYIFKHQTKTCYFWFCGIHIINVNYYEVFLRLIAFYLDILLKYYLIVSLSGLTLYIHENHYSHILWSRYTVWNSTFFLLSLQRNKFLKHYTTSGLFYNSRTLFQWSTKSYLKIYFRKIFWFLFSNTC